MKVIHFYVQKKWCVAVNILNSFFNTIICDFFFDATKTMYSDNVTIIMFGLNRDTQQINFNTT